MCSAYCSVKRIKIKINKLIIIYRNIGGVGGGGKNKLTAFHISMNYLKLQ